AVSAYFEDHPEERQVRQRRQHVPDDTESEDMEADWDDDAYWDDMEFAAACESLWQAAMAGADLKFLRTRFEAPRQQLQKTLGEPVACAELPPLGLVRPDKLSI